MTVNGANAIGIDIKTSDTNAVLDGPGSVQVSGTDAVGIKLGSGTETTIDSWNLNVADSSAGAGIELGNNSKLELKMLLRRQRLMECCCELQVRLL